MKNGKKRYAKCILSYVEDGNEYWTKGSFYKFRKHKDGTFEIETNLGGRGRVGPGFMCDDFEEYFEVVWE